MDYQKNTTVNIRHENRVIKNKTNKNWKRIQTMYCLGCKDYTNTFKVLREKSNCVVCRSSKSRF